MSCDSHLLSFKDTINALPVDLDYIPKELKIRAKTELFEDENVREQCLKSLRTMLGKEHNLCWQDDDIFLLAFLRARKFDVDRAFNLLKGFYTNIGKHGHFYYNLNFDRLKRNMEENIYSILPFRNDEGSAILLFRCGGWDPHISNAMEHMHCVSLGLLQALRSPPTHIAGFHLIADMKNFSLKQIAHVSPSVLKFFIDMIQNALPVRMRGLHVVHQNHLFSYIWQLCKIFLSKKLRERVHFHGNDMKSLHKFVHPSILPANLEGELPPFDNTNWRERMEASTDYFKHVFSFGYENHLEKDWKKDSKTSGNQ